MEQGIDQIREGLVVTPGLNWNAGDYDMPIWIPLKWVESDELGPVGPRQEKPATASA